MSDARRIEYVPLSSLKSAKSNPKKHADTDVKTSIGRFGYVEPMVVDERTGLLVAGHGRKDALTGMKAAGQDAPDGVTSTGGEWLVPVLRGWESRSDIEAKAYLLASNQLTALGGWDNASLTEMLKELSDAGALDGVGFGDAELTALLDAAGPRDGETDPDDIPEAPAESYVKLGDTYSLGDHRITCGDSTDPKVYERLMQGDRADIIWTDPPWNVDYTGKTKDALKISNDNMGEAFPGFCAAFSLAMVEYVHAGAPIYLTMAISEWSTIDPALKAAGFHWSSTIIWAKDSLVISRKDYHMQFEPIWYGWQQDAARLVPLEDRKQSDLWSIARPKRSEDHPTTKPVELVERALKNSSKLGNLVLEPFSGSGTVILACERTGRRARAIELEPRYVQVAIERWEKFTGKKSERVG